MNDREQKEKQNRNRNAYRSVTLGVVEGRDLVFDAYRARILTDEYCREHGKKKEQVLGLVSSSYRTVRNWLSGANGPSDIASVIELAEAIELSDYHLLLMERPEVSGGKRRLTAREKKAVNRLHPLFLKFIYEKYQEIMDRAEGIYGNRADAIMNQLRGCMDESNWDLPAAIWNQYEELYIEICGAEDDKREEQMKNLERISSMCRNAQE